MFVENFSSVFFTLNNFSMTPELFIGYSLLQLSLYTVSCKYLITVSAHLKRTGFGDFRGFGCFVFFLTTLLLLNETVYTVHGFSSFNHSLANDHFSFFVKLVLSVTAFVFFISLCNSPRSAASLSNSFEFHSFLAAAVLGSLLICSANDFITAYLAIELQSISFYFMACSKKNSSYSIESGLKYFIIGSFSSAFFLLGSAFIYVSCGTLNFFELNTILPLLFAYKECYPNLEEIDQTIFSMAFSILGLSLLVKLAVAPMHLWSIDVYESSPTATTYFFAAVPKLGFFTLLVKIFYLGGFFVFMTGFSTSCVILAITSVALGALGGIEQRKLKSLLAYSSLGHTGYALLAFSTGTETGIVFALYYFIFYMASTVCFWSVFILLKKKHSTLFCVKLNKEIGDLSMLKKTNPVLAFILSLVLFSLAGIPPVIGFLIKFGAFLTVIQSSFYLVSVIGIALTVGSSFYYLRIVKVLFFENTTAGKLYCPVTSNNASLISILFVFLVLFFVKPSLPYLLVIKACLLLQ